VSLTKGDELITNETIFSVRPELVEGSEPKIKINMYTYIVLALTIFIIDRITKVAALAWWAESAYKVNSFLSFEVVFNRGISWGMLHSTNDIMFIAVSLIIAVITVGLCWYAYHRYVHGDSIIAETCIIAGSIANLVDRIVYHGVIDFIILSYGSLSWPVFNVADAMIVLGVGLLLLRYEK
jgi:signal peptidase II